ncbi:uncharacterized protein PFL1_04272 [Pseudozyma flocculosa PF-1]|uniref:Uncharacterized protein n=2 Tax=Pseudozyma flocculosa TaxID=84751 RepID=A0A5C3ETD9_9BASI|nr:uncharacterized protein PFL1_04272 [Pseudozyma flocculosa PF-1]EPQ28446.1 hypothetical protein PFL1_04272 [Pseudozyma flocculosa PF-1]SPO35623.1 uncharacterized protein PSFLO_01094 [Pseudozyma flocculosa]
MAAPKPSDNAQPDYIFRPEDPEQLQIERRAQHDQDQHQHRQRLRNASDSTSTSTHTQPGGLSQRYQQLAMDQQEQKALVRVQILTPLSVLLQLGVMIICGSKLISPNLGQVSRRHPTYLTVSEPFVLLYWAVLYLLQIGFAVFLLLSRTPETKKAIVHGVGTRLALANYMMVLWAIFWVLDRRIPFILGTVSLGVIALLLLFNSLVLAVKYRPSKRHPLDWLFIHVPIKMLLVITLQYDLWQQLFMALQWDAGSGHGDQLLQMGLWPAFGIIAGMGVFSALWIFSTADVTWTVAGIYLNIGLLWSKQFPIAHPDHPRPAALTAATILAISLQVVAFIASVAWSRIQARQEGRIALPMSPEDEAAAVRAETERRARASTVADRRHAAAAAPVQPGDEEARIEAPSAEAEAGGSQQGVSVTRKLGSSSTTTNKSPTKSGAPAAK